MHIKQLCVVLLYEFFSFGVELHPGVELRDAEGNHFVLVLSADFSVEIRVALQTDCLACLLKFVFRQEAEVIAHLLSQSCVLREVNRASAVLLAYSVVDIHVIDHDVEFDG